VKRHLTTILLVVAAAALALYLLLTKDRLTTTEQKGREHLVFPAWRRDDVTRLEVTHEGETIVLERANREALWRMTSPREERVDQSAAERLTTTMEFATRLRPVVAGDTLGLDRPRATGVVKMGTLQFTIALGGASPRPEGSSYFRIDDGAPFVGSKELADALLAGSDAYRDRSVIPYLSLEMSKFEVIHGAQGQSGFIVERFDERSFRIPSLEVLASKKALDRAWSAVAEMRAEAFPKDADADRLTANPQMTLRLTPKDTTKGIAELVVGGACPGHPDDVVVLRKQPTRAAACAPKGAIDQLREITPAMLVDTGPFSFRHDEIEEIRFEGDDVKTIELARRGTGFHQRKPVDRELSAAEGEAVSELLVMLEKTAASDVKAGRGAPFTSIAKAKIWVSERSEEVEVAAAEDGKAVVRRVRDDARLTLTAAQARRLVPRETTLRPLGLVTNETRKVTRAALRCGVEQDLEDTGAGLKLVKPVGYETDGKIRQLTDTLLRGKVLEWNADRDDGSFGITEDGCRVTLSFADGNTPLTVRLGRQGEGGVFGAVDGERGVFITGQSLETMMRTIYVSLASLRIEDATKVEAKVAGGRRAANAAELSGLFADRVISLGSSDVGPIELELLVTRPEAGAPRRIVCSPSDGDFRRCATPSVKAVFEVKDAVLGKIVPPVPSAISDAGTPDAR
jgi:hypothetical protein